MKKTNLDNIIIEDNFIKKTVASYLLSINSDCINRWQSNTRDRILQLADYFNIELRISDEKLYGRNNNINVLNILQKELSEITFSSANSPTKKKIDLLSKIYHLNEIEYNYFLYYISKNECREFSEFIGTIGHSGKYFFGNIILNISNIKASQTIDSIHQKGLIEDEGGYRRNSRFELHENITEILDDDNINSEKKIKGVLLGKTLKPNLKWDDYDYLENKRDKASRILKSAVERKTKGINILLYGDVGTGKTEFVKMLADHLKINLYSVTYEDCNGDEAQRRVRLSDLKSKQTILSIIENSCILFDEAEDVLNNGYYGNKVTSKAYLNSIIENTPTPILWTTNKIHDVDPAVLRRMTYAIPFEKPSEDIRLKVWKNILKKNRFKLNNNKLIELSKRYEVSPSIITNAVNTTKLINGNEDDFIDSIESVTQVVSKKKNIRKSIEANLSDYNNLLVNTDIDASDLTQKLKNSRKLNFSLCLYGEPGTGKSLYAKHLANVLGLEFILKRASDLKSKWVGETEQNIAHAFDEAKFKKAMLIFDEADSFLQSRNNARASWEVSEVNEMLTQMENHNYPFVCTTNLMETLDEASLRRFTFKIKFDFMTEEQANLAFEHFFGIKDANITIKGLTAGDFATVKKKAEFLNISDKDELIKMLNDEVKVKKSETLKQSVGF